MNIAAAYIRVSDDRQDEYSPDSQLKLVREFAKKNDFYVPDEFVFYDDGISAKTAKRRPEFNRMISIAKQKEPPFSKIYVWKFSRFARNQEESIVFKSLLRKNGVEVVSISEPLIDGVFGSLVERIIEWMDEYYLIRLSGEVKRGMTEKASRGEAMCGRIFGYDYINKTYQPNSDSQYIVKIFEDYANGKKERQIARELALMGVRTTRGNTPDNRFVNYILHNPVYIGKIRWSTDGRAASKRDYDNDNIMVVQGSHKPLIDEELWNKVQKMLKENERKYKKYQRPNQSVEFMLKGLLRCDNCGSTLVMQSTKCPSVQCHKYAKGSCGISHSISVAKANRIVIEALENAVGTLNFNIETEKTKNETKIDFDKFISAEKNKLEKAKEAYLNGVDTVEEYAKNKKEILANIEDLEKQKIKVNTSVADFDKQQYAKKVADVLEIIKSPDTSEQVKNDVLRTVISKIVFNKAKNSLDLFFYL